MKAVLLLEGAPPVRNFLLNILEHYHTIETATAAEALRVFAAHTPIVDLLVADVILPTSSGIQVALSRGGREPADHFKVRLPRTFLE